MKLKLPSMVKVTKTEWHPASVTIHFYLRKWHPMYWWIALTVLVRMFREDFDL